jgi:hypothetical protein
MITSELTNALADAIAYAEGFYVSGSRAYRNNNPGDLTLDITGTGVGYDGPFVIYASAMDGWDALKRQIQKMIDGTSAIYDPSMSILDIASRYTTTEVNAWANNVAMRLGVTIETTLNDLLSTSTGTTIGGTVLMILLGLFFLIRRK